MIVSMDTRSRSPESPRRTRRRGPSFRVKLLLRLLGLLLVAAIVVGIGTTTSKGWGPDFRGEGPQISAEEAASRSMLALARSATDLAAGPESPDDGSAVGTERPTPASPAVSSMAVGAKSAQELERAAKLLRDHVELLTPGLAARVAQETATGTVTDAPAMPDANLPGAPGESSENPTTALATSGAEALARISLELGTSANALLGAAATAEPSDAAAVIGAGIEQRLEAQRLASLVPDDVQTKELQQVEIAETDTAWHETLANQLPAGSCVADDAPSGSGSSEATSAGPVSGSEETEAATSEQQRAADSILKASDAAFRQAYGYQMAAVKHPGAATRQGVKLSATTSELGHRLEDLLPADCPPTREAAYALPDGFDAAPIGSIAESEEQLAALLRDAAARAPQVLRPVLITESWLSADRFFALSGKIPDLTKTA